MTSYRTFLRKFQETHPKPDPQPPEEKGEGAVIPFHRASQQFGGDGDNQSQTPQQMH